MKRPETTPEDVVTSIINDPLNHLTNRSPRDFGLPAWGTHLRRMVPHTWASTNSTIKDHSPKGLLNEADTIDRHPSVTPGFLEFSDQELQDFGSRAPRGLESPTGRYSIAAGYQQDDRGIECSILVAERRSISRRIMDWMVGNLTSSLSHPERTLRDTEGNRLLQESDFQEQLEGIKNRVITGLQAGRITRLSRDPMTVRALKELEEEVKAGEIEGVSSLFVRPVYLETLHKRNISDAFNIHTVKNATYCIDVSASPGDKFVNLDTLLKQNPQTDQDVYIFDENEPLKSAVRAMQEEHNTRDIVVPGTHIECIKERALPMREIHERTIQVLQMLADV